jgi:Phage portal protein
MPTVNNTGTLNQGYFDQALQPITENIELHLDEGLELTFPNETWFDTSSLLRMDTAARMDIYSKNIGGGWFMPNEARRAEDLPPVEGGETPYMQQQNFALAALARRDQKPEVEGAEDGAVQDTAMNGAQVTSLQTMLTAVANNQLPAETARAAISAAFPALSDAEIDAMIKPLLAFEPESPQPETPPAEPAPEPEPEPDETDLDEQALREYVKKRLAA